MPTDRAQPDRARRAGRRTVRIVKPRGSSRAATISFAVACAVALMLVVVWRVWNPETKVEAVKRKIVDVQMEWKCEVGHTFRAAGQVEAKACWTCDRPSYPVTEYTCPVHGRFEVGVRFLARPDNSIGPSDLRFSGEDWVDIDKGLECPKCERKLIYVPLDPLEKAKRRSGS